MKKLLLCILSTIILLTSCTWSKDERVISKIERIYGKYNGYKCQTITKIITGEKESIYTTEETFTKPNKYKLEILKPKESQGIIILNLDDKISVEHPSIEQSISLVTVKSLNKQILIGDFFQRLSKSKLLKSHDINDEEFLVFEIKLEEKNKYRDTARIWLNKKDYIPYKLNIYDESGSLKVEIRYEKFKFIRSIKNIT